MPARMLAARVLERLLRGDINRKASLDMGPESPTPRCDGRLVFVVALVTGLAAVDIYVGSSVVLIELYAFAPIVAALGLGPRRTGVVAAWALLLAVVAGIPQGILATPDHLVRSCTVALAGLLAIHGASLRRGLESTGAKLEAVVNQLPGAIVVAEASTGGIILDNDRVGQVLKLPGEPTLDLEGYVGLAFHPDGRPYDLDEMPLARARRGEKVTGEEMDYLFGDGSRGVLEVSAAPIRDGRGRVEGCVALFHDATERRRSPEREQAARLAAETAARRSSFLAKAAALLSSSDDWESTLSGVAMTAVPEWADWCSFAMLDPDGSIRRVAIAHEAPEKELSAWQLERRYPVDRLGQSATAQVIRSGRTLLLNDIPAEARETEAVDAEQARLLAVLGVSHVLVVPLRSGARSIGALTFVSSERERRFEPGDVALAEELASRCAIAVDAARRGQAAREYEERFRLLVESVEDYALVLLDPSGRVTSWNTGAERIMGFTEEQILGRHICCFYPSDQSAQGIPDDGLRVAEQEGHFAEEGHSVRSDGTAFYARSVTRPLHDDDGRLRGFSRVTHDVTERHRLEMQLEHQAFHDSLTGLPNRTLFLDRVDHALSLTGRHDGQTAVMFFDLDSFKAVNDSLGHAAGDKLLVQSARRVHEAVRAEDTVARFGGDEFVVLCEQLSGRDDALAVARRIAAAFAAPFLIDDRPILVGASVGVAFADPGQVSQGLLQRADAAMYCAKQAEPGSIVVFEHGMDAGEEEHPPRTVELRRAFERDELRLAYQPLVDLRGGMVAGVEALVRWQHPERGLLPPAEFIDLAEDTGLIVPLGEWVLATACEQVARWTAQRPDRAPLVLSVAVNLSPRQLAGAGMVRAVEDALEESGIDPQALCLEITESKLMNDPDYATTLLALKGLGVRLAIDDFGTGYSSLSYLKRFPVHQLKIDRSFVSGLTHRSDDAAIVAAMIRMASALGLVVVGEGIETEEQAQALRELGCDLGQGYLWSRPVPAEGLEAMLGSVPTARVGGHRRARRPGVREVA